MNFLPPSSQDYAVIVGWRAWCRFDIEQRLEWITKGFLLCP